MRVRVLLRARQAPYPAALVRRLHSPATIYVCLAVVTVAYSAFQLTSALVFAAEHSMMPEVWGERGGNHGPWRIPWLLRDRIPLRDMVWNAILGPSIGVLAAGAWFLASPARTRFYFLAFQCVLWMLVVGNFYWLID